jgi:RNA polymerase sigma-70 factor (ECF subfamily)
VETLLRHAGWVRGLAYSLVRNAADAEDLLHDTWVRALTHPPKEGGDVRTWFRRVMRNIRRQNYRTETARIAREQFVAGARAAKRPDEVVERAETLRRIAGHVLALPEPYRRTVLLRHFDELPPAAIAERDGEPVETVRTRLKRAYAMLGERLAEEDGPDWPLALLPLLRWPAAPIPVPPPRRRPPIPPVVLAAAGAAVVAAAALLASAPLGVRATHVLAPRRETASARPRADAPPVPRSSAAGAAATGAAVASAGADAGSTGAAAPAAVPPKSAGGFALVGTVETDAGPPPDAVRLHLTALVAGPPQKNLETRDVTAAAGAISATLPLADAAGRRVVEWDVQVDEPEYMPYSSRVRMPLPSDGVATVRMDPVRLQRAGHVSGTVAFDPASPGDAATVGTIPIGAMFMETFDSVTAAPGARFRVRAQPGRRMLVAAVAKDRVPAAQEIQVDAGTDKDVGVLSLAEGVRASGRVGTRPPLPLGPKPTVSVVSKRPFAFSFSLAGRYITYDAGVAWTYMVIVPAGADGSFTAGGLLPGPFRIDDYVTSGVPDAMKAAVLTPFDAPTDHAEFVYSGSVVRVLVRRGGAPLPGAVVGFGSRSGSVAGDDGVAQFLGEPGHAYSVTASAKGSATVQSNVVVPADGGGAEATLDLPEPAAAPRNATWTLTLRTPSGDVPQIAGIGFRPVPGAKPAGFGFTRDVTGENGVFRVADVPPGRWRIEVRPGCGWYDPTGFAVAAPITRDFAPGEAAADEIPLSPGGRLVVSALEADGSHARLVTCRVFDAAHADVSVGFGWLMIGGGSTTDTGSNTISSSAPSDVFPALPPGRYTVEFDQYPAGRLVRASATVDVVAGKAAEAVVRFPPR